MAALVPPERPASIWQALPGGVAPQPQSEGGVGGPLDPWKALLVRWDPGTPSQWPVRVSPWEVSQPYPKMPLSQETRNRSPKCTRLHSSVPS